MSYSPIHIYVQANKRKRASGGSDCASPWAQGLLPDASFRRTRGGSRRRSGLHAAPNSRDQRLPWRPRAPGVRVDQGPSGGGRRRARRDPRQRRRALRLPGAPPRWRRRDAGLAGLESRLRPLLDRGDERLSARRRGDRQPRAGLGRGHPPGPDAGVALSLGGGECLRLSHRQAPGLGRSLPDREPRRSPDRAGRLHERPHQGHGRGQTGGRADLESRTGRRSRA